MFKWFRSKLSRGDLAIDLGTANTLIYLSGEGIVLNEPSIVAVRKTPEGGRTLVNVGNEAKQMLGRTPADLETIRPLRDGVIANLTVTEYMLSEFIRRVYQKSRLPMTPNPAAVICVPAGATEVESQALYKAATHAGCYPVSMVAEPVAAAIGAGMAIDEARGSMIVDVGGGTTEVATISLNGVAYSKSIRIGGDKFDEAIIDYVRNTFGVQIGLPSAERIKHEIGCAYPTTKVQELEFRGHNQKEGGPRSFTINSNEVLEALQEPLMGIIKAVKSVLELTQPELAADVADRGIVLTGGGALLKDFDKLLMEETGLNVIMADDPLTSVVMGAGRVVEQIDSQYALPFLLKNN